MQRTRQHKFVYFCHVTGGSNVLAGQILFNKENEAKSNITVTCHHLLEKCANVLFGADKLLFFFKKSLKNIDHETQIVDIPTIITIWTCKIYQQQRI